MEVHNEEVVGHLSPFLRLIFQLICHCLFLLKRVKEKVMYHNNGQHGKIAQWCSSGAYIFGVTNTV